VPLIGSKPDAQPTLEHTHVGAAVWRQQIAPVHAPPGVARPCPHTHEPPLLLQPIHWHMHCEPAAG
jgi:hypothetical protein